MECDVSPAAPPVQTNRMTTKQSQQSPTVVVGKAAAHHHHSGSNNGNSASGTTSSTITSISSSSTASGPAETSTSGMAAASSTPSDDDPASCTSALALSMVTPPSMVMGGVGCETIVRRSIHSNISMVNNNKSFGGIEEDRTARAGRSMHPEPVTGTVIEISDQSTADDLSYPEQLLSETSCVLLSDDCDSSLPAGKEDDPLTISISDSLERLPSLQCSTPNFGASQQQQQRTAAGSVVAAPVTVAAVPTAPKHNHHLRRNVPRLANSSGGGTGGTRQQGLRQRRGSAAGSSDALDKRHRQTAEGGASTMREVLASIPGFSIKPRRRTNKKLSTAAQLEQTREGCVDLETPDSILVHCNLRALLNRETFQLLPPLYQYKLVQLLPPVDRPPVLDAPECERNGIRLNPSSLNNEFFARASQEWRDRLSEGEFTPEAQLKLRAEADRERSKVDPWKLKHFEPMWGDRKYAGGAFIGAAGTMANPAPPAPPVPPPALLPSASVTKASSSGSLSPVLPMSVVGAVMVASAPTPSVAGHPRMVQPLQKQPVSTTALTAGGRVIGTESSVVPARTLTKPPSVSSVVSSTTTVVTKPPPKPSIVATSSSGAFVLPPRTTISVAGSGMASAFQRAAGTASLGGAPPGGSVSVVPISIVAASSTSSYSATSIARPALKTTIKLRPTTAIATSTTANALGGHKPFGHPVRDQSVTLNPIVATISARTVPAASSKRLLPTTVMGVSGHTTTGSSGSGHFSTGGMIASIRSSSGSQPMSPKRLRTVGAVTRSALAGTGHQQQQHHPHHHHHPLVQHHPLSNAALSITTTLGGPSPAVVPPRPSPIVVQMVETTPNSFPIAAGAVSSLKRTHSNHRSVTPDTLGSNCKISKRRTEDATGSPRRLLTIVTTTVPGTVGGSSSIVYRSSSSSINNRLITTNNAVLSTSVSSTDSSSNSDSSTNNGGNSNSSRINLSSSSTISSSESKLTTNNTTTVAAATAAECDTLTIRTTCSGAGSALLADRRRRAAAALGEAVARQQQSVKAMAAMQSSRRRMRRQEQDTTGGGSRTNSNRSNAVLGPATTIILDDDADHSATTLIDDDAILNGGSDSQDERSSSSTLVPSSDIILEEAIDCGDVVDCGSGTGSGDDQQQQQWCGNGKRGEDRAATPRGRVLPATAGSLIVKYEDVNHQQQSQQQSQQQQQPRMFAMAMGAGSGKMTSASNGRQAVVLPPASIVGGSDTQMIYDHNSGQMFSIVCVPSASRSSTSASPNVSNAAAAAALGLRSLPASLTVTALPQQQQQQQQQQQLLSISNDSSNSSSVSTTAMMAASDNHLDAGAGTGGNGGGGNPQHPISTFENVLQGGSEVGNDLVIVHHQPRAADDGDEGATVKDNDAEDVQDVDDQQDDEMLPEEEDEDDEDEDDDDDEDDGGVHTTTATNTADEDEEEEEENEMEEGMEEEECSAEGVFGPEGNVRHVIQHHQHPGNDGIYNGVISHHNPSNRHRAHHRHTHLNSHPHLRPQPSTPGVVNMNLTAFHHDHVHLHQQHQQQQSRGNDGSMMLMVPSTTTTMATGSADEGGLEEDYKEQEEEEEEEEEPSSNSVDGGSNYCDNASAADEDPEEEVDDGGGVDHHPIQHDGDHLLLTTHNAHAVEGGVLHTLGQNQYGAEQLEDAKSLNDYGSVHHHHQQHQSDGSATVVEEDGSGGTSFLLDHQQMQQLQRQYQQLSHGQGILHHEQQLHPAVSPVAATTLIQGAAGSGVPGGGSAAHILLRGARMSDVGDVLTDGLVVNGECGEMDQQQQPAGFEQHEEPNEDEEEEEEDEEDEPDESLGSEDGHGTTGTTLMPQHYQQQQQLMEKYIDEVDGGSSSAGGGGGGYTVLETTGGEMISTEIVEHNHDQDMAIMLEPIVHSVPAGEREPVETVVGGEETVGGDDAGCMVANGEQSSVNGGRIVAAHQHPFRGERRSYGGQGPPMLDAVVVGSAVINEADAVSESNHRKGVLVDGEGSFNLRMPPTTTPLSAAATRRTTILVVEDQQMGLIETARSINGTHAIQQQHHHHQQQQQQQHRKVKAVLKQSIECRNDGGGATVRHSVESLPLRIVSESGCIGSLETGSSLMFTADPSSSFSEPDGGQVDAVAEDALACGDWPQFKMKMMDTTKMLVVDHHQLVDGSNSIILSPLGATVTPGMASSPTLLAGATQQVQHQHQQQLHLTQTNLHSHLTNAAATQQHHQHTMQASPTTIPVATATIVQQIATNHQQQQQPAQLHQNTTTGISFLAHHPQQQPTTVQTLAAVQAAQQQQSHPQGMNIFQIHTQPQQQQQQPTQQPHHTAQTMLGGVVTSHPVALSGGGTIQLTSEIKDGIRNNLIKTEPGVSYTTIRQGNQQIVTRIKLESDDGGQLQQHSAQQQPFQAQLSKVNVVTSSAAPLIALGGAPNQNQDNLTRVIESVAGNYGSAVTQQVVQQPQQQQQQQPQLIQHVQTATGQQIRFEMDPSTNHHHALLQQATQPQQAPQPTLITQQQHQPKFIITSRPMTSVVNAVTGTKLPLAVQQATGQQFIHAQDQQIHQTQPQQQPLSNQATVTTIQKPIQLQKIIMSTAQQQQRPRLPLQRAQFALQAQHQPQQTQAAAKLAQPQQTAQVITPTQSQQRFQQKFVTNQLIRGQNAAILMNSGQFLSQQPQQQAQPPPVTVVGANVVVGSTQRKRPTAAAEVQSGGAPMTSGATTGGIGGSTIVGQVTAGAGGGGGMNRRGGGRTSSSRLPPGAVNLERSYQICQAVIQNSPNRHQLRAQLKSPQAFLAASNSNSNSSISSIGSTGSNSSSNSSSSSSSSGVSASSIIGNTKEDTVGGGTSVAAATTFGAALGIGANKVAGPRLMNPKRIVTTSGGRNPPSIVVRQVYTGGGTTGVQSNPISIIAQSTQQPVHAVQQQHQQQQIHALGEQLQQHAQIISVTAAPTIVQTAGNNNGGNPITGPAVSGPGAAASNVGNFGGKYVLVQRAAHIGEIVTPRAASAPPTHNQIHIHHVPAAPQTQLQQQITTQQLTQQQVVHHQQQQQQQQQLHQQGQPQQLAPSMQATITRRIPSSTHVIAYGQDPLPTAASLEPMAPSGGIGGNGANGSPNALITSGGTAGGVNVTRGNVVIIGGTAAASYQYNHATLLDRSRGATSNPTVVVSNGAASGNSSGLLPQTNLVNLVSPSTTTTIISPQRQLQSGQTAVVPAFLQQHSQQHLNHQLSSGSDSATGGHSINLGGINIVVGSLNAAGGTTLHYQQLQPQQQQQQSQPQQQLIIMENDLGGTAAPQVCHESEPGGGSGEDRKACETVRVAATSGDCSSNVGHNGIDCSCSLNASSMVACQQCGAFCRDDCITGSKLCVSCVIR